MEVESSDYTISRNNIVIKAINSIVCVGAWISGIGIVGIMLLTGASVAARYFFQHPWPGDMEVTELLLIPIAFSAFGYTQIRHGHVNVEVLISRFSRHTRAIIQTFVYFISAGLFALMAWAFFNNALTVALNPYQGLSSSVLGISYTPFIFIASVGISILVLALLVDCYRALIEAVRK